MGKPGDVGFPCRQANPWLVFFLNQLKFESSVFSERCLAADGQDVGNQPLISNLLFHLAILTKVTIPYERLRCAIEGEISGNSNFHFPASLLMHYLGV